MDKDFPHSVRSFLASLSKKGASKSKLGIRIFDDGASGYITRADGGKRYFRYTLNDVNTAGSYSIAKFKHLTKQALKDFSIRVPEGVTINAPKDLKNLEKVCKKFLNNHKFPLVVKPASLSKGVGVFIVKNKRDLILSIKKVVKIDSTILVEEFIRGVDHRFVVFRGKVICVYSKNPTGPCMPSNLSLGGVAKDVTTMVHPDFVKLALKISRELNLPFCGIDIVIHGNISKPENRNYAVLEVNSAPDSSYFAQLGKKQDAMINKMYDDMFDFLINEN